MVCVHVGVWHRPWHQNCVCVCVVWSCAAIATKKIVLFLHVINTH